jgi:hypothetical protein
MFQPKTAEEELARVERLAEDLRNEPGKPAPTPFVQGPVAPARPGGHTTH